MGIPVDVWVHRCMGAPVSAWVEESMGWWTGVWMCVLSEWASVNMPRTQTPKSNL